ncbi:MAG: hypothetical protein HOP17_08990, partial [Acidobacteria bacterium]|nr:hypothetical protein [Acidobacteriota bacterium]
MSNDHKEEQIGGMKLREEEIGFSTDQMIACTKCGKSNPPNRANCLYCASSLANFVDSLGGPKLNLRQLENWENGFNVVQVSRIQTADTATIAKFLGHHQENLEDLLGATNCIPLARLESESDAAIARDHLTQLGLDVRIVTDVVLKVGKPNVRARSVDFLSEGICVTSFNTGETKTFSSDQIALIVIGTVFESKHESVEKRKKKGERKAILETATSTDDLVVDLYGSADEQGWRIMAKGFDFSGLGSEKALLAGDNMTRLLGKIRTFASAAKFVDEYGH